MNNIGLLAQFTSAALEFTYSARDPMLFIIKNPLFLKTISGDAG